MPDFEQIHKQNIYRYAKQVEDAYISFAKKIAAIANDPKAKFQRSFRFSNNKVIQQKTDALTGEFNNILYDLISASIKKEWDLANQKNDVLIKETIKAAEVLNLVPGLTDHNISALKAFIERKENGLNLSERVWNLSKSFQDELEMHLQIGIVNGDSADVISRRIRENLLEPEKIFRRVRDKRGNLILSQNAKAFHPGQGVYRSSYKNARRIAVTETNMSYRNADHERWMKNPTIIGFEVKLSHSHPASDICDYLKGKYPKSFVFNGWHPHCFCYAVPIMLNDKEFDNYIDSILDGKKFDPTTSENYVSSVPEGFTNWIDKNKTRIANMKTPPYFIKDNFKGGDISGGLNIKGLKPVDIKAPEKVKEITEPVKVSTSSPIQDKVPVDLRSGSNFLKGTDIVFNNDFFELIDETKPVTLKIKRGGTSLFNPTYNTVEIGSPDRLALSNAYKERVIYHEFGHAIDYQRGMRYSTEVKELMDKYRKLLNKRVTYTRNVREWDFQNSSYRYVKRTNETSKIAMLSDRLSNLYSYINRMPESVFTKRGISKYDIIESILSTQDTIMSLNPNYGFGHTKAYFKRPGAKEAEFIAHCFENAFPGNAIFKKFLPELYIDMINYISTLK
jgi:hypothetical protein